MDVETKSEFGWSLSSFGHGMFQQIVMKPIVFQTEGYENFTAHTCSSVLLADHPIVVGVLLSKPQGYKGSTADFTSYIQMAIHHIEFGFSVLHEGSDVLHETFYMTALQQANIPVLGHAVSITDAGVAVTFNTSLNIAKQYLHIPLQFLVTMNLIQSQGKPFNQRLIMDKTEMNVRLLMDLNRYRPQKVPERSLVIPIQIVHPLRVTSSVREVTADLSVLSVSVRNMHDSAQILIDDVVFHTDRMAQSIVHANYEQSIPLVTLADVFQITLLNQKETDIRFTTTDAHGVVVLPHEEYTFLYSISLRNPTQPMLLSDISLFATPVTLYWSVNHIGSTNSTSAAVVYNAKAVRDILDDSNTDYRPFRSELDCVVNWTLGSASSITATAAPTLPTHSAVIGGNALQITLVGPSLVHAYKTVDLRVCVMNRASTAVVAPVLHAQSRYDKKCPSPQYTIALVNCILPFVFTPSVLIMCAINTLYTLFN